MHIKTIFVNQEIFLKLISYNNLNPDTVIYIKKNISLNFENKFPCDYFKQQCICRKHSYLETMPPEKISNK